MLGRGTRRRQQQGAAAVEFALVAPLLLLLVFGIISYGYMLSFRQAISQGAAEGARAAAIWPIAYADGQQGDRRLAATTRINEALSSYGVTCSDPGVTCSVEFVTCDGADTCTEVTVSYPYDDDPLTPSLPFIPMPESLEYVAEVKVT